MFALRYFPARPHCIVHSLQFIQAPARLALRCVSTVTARDAATMAEKSTVPMIHQDTDKIQQLITNLNNSKVRGKKGFSCKSTTFTVEGSKAGVQVESWRFQDWDYKRSDLPTYARGLFTTVNEKGQPEIAIRGYDKFFNENEVPSTRWRTVEANTHGPYELSLKENGCIIFISGVSDGSLLVCSKHSTGARADAELSHATAGERRLDLQLQALGRTREDLAKELRSRNATAVAELCDDGFEEHVLEYKGDAAGLYLHGINLNLPEFVTYSGAHVQHFAEQWGFKKTDFLMINDITETKTFLEGVAQTGAYEGRELEGFVIRCKSRVNASGPFEDWFFKYKFEEPYLMYRQWRECTKAIINGKAPRFKKHVKITEEYLLYVRQRLAQDKSLGPAYLRNHRIIELRDDFLKEKNLKGSDIIRQEYAAMGGEPRDVSKDVILVPIATIGCGKTTIAVALQHLFGWGHVQNDNITGARRPPRFTSQVLGELIEKPVVIADRNNASEHERDQILNDVLISHPHVRLVALNFAHTPATMDKIRNVTLERVLARGDNHQTIQAASSTAKVVGIMDGFLKRFQPCDPSKSPDDGFDTVIELDPTAESRENLEVVIGQLSNHYPKLFKEMPTSEAMDEAIQLALSGYKPELRHTIADRGAKQNGQKEKQESKKQPAKVKAKPLEYVCVDVPKQTVTAALDAAFAAARTEDATFFHELKQNGRVQSDFHITLIHKAASKEHPLIWQRYCDIHRNCGGGADKLGHCQIMMERVVWDDRIMAIVVRIVEPGKEDWQTVNEVAHITVGTRGIDVKPKESNALLKRWLEVGSGEASGIKELVIASRDVIDGLVHGVLGR